MLDKQGQMAWVARDAFGVGTQGHSTERGTQSEKKRNREQERDTERERETEKQRVRNLVGGTKVHR